MTGWEPVYPSARREPYLLKKEKPVPLTRKKAVQEYMLQSSQKQQPVQFPVQLHLINPQNTIFKGADLLLAADCIAFAAKDFHTRYLKNKVLAIACPKLDSNRDAYVEKLALIMEQKGVETVTALIMEVPCCGGLLEIVKKAREKCTRYIPVKKVILTTQGNLKTEEWIK